jgi:hypothetical protein
VRDSRVVRPGWVVELSQVKMNATTHVGNVMHFPHKPSQDTYIIAQGLAFGYTLHGYYPGIGVLVPRG